MTADNNTSRRFVIVGGVAGGMSCATRLRRLDENAKITVIERSGYVSFANCGLPYYIGGIIGSRDSLLLQTPQALAARFNIDVHVNTTVTAIDAKAQVVTLTDAAGNTSELAYDDLVLSPGARPIVPPLPGIERALVLRTVEDTDSLAAATSQTITKAGEHATAVVIGGGFIGLEVAENLRHRGLEVSVVEAQSQVMAPLDPEMAGLVHRELRKNGVNLYLGSAVQEIGENTVTLANGTRIAADMVVAAIGVRPDTTLATAAGIALGERGGIAVNERLQTSDPHIWAVGDAVEKVDGWSGESTLIPLANTANRQGRILADILCGRTGVDRPVIGTAIVPVFDLTVAATGWNEKRLRATKRNIRIIHTHPYSHATYYPGADAMALKLLVDADTDEILGAQAVGGDGVDKRIDILATAIAGGLKAADLADLELAYAPKYGSAKDPINFLGYVDQNLRDGLTESIEWDEVADAVAAGAHIIDVRTAGEFAHGTILNAINIPVDELRDRLSEVPEGQIIVNCAVGIRGHIAAQILTHAGRQVKNLDGGYKTWVASPANPENR